MKMRLSDRILRVGATAAHRLFRLMRPRRGSGVHAVALTPERHIILVRLRYAAGWRLPGGGRREHEDPVEAVLRELREEIGMTAHGPVRIGLADSPDDDGRGSPVLIIEGVRYSPARWSWEVERIIEAPLDDLPEDIAPITRSWLAELRGRI
jgi:8-oxo-dGTP pyrophosphatase MutT (NUDIX family)